MKVSEYTIEFLGSLIAGNLDGTPYRSGRDLVTFFNKFGARDVYPTKGGFLSRHVYAQDKLRALNGQAILMQVVSTALDPRAFLKYQLVVEPVLGAVNEYLKHDGYEVVKEGMAYKVRECAAGSVKLEVSAKVSHELTQIAIDENIKKCEEKLTEGDYSGAITNARSLVESVLIGIEREFDGQALDYDGNLQGLYKRVQKHLHLEPDRKDVSDPLRQILSGMVSVVGGLAAVRNKMGDAHATSYRPARHHARLAVHSAITLSNFLFETKNYQQVRKAQPSVKTKPGNSE